MKPEPETLLAAAPTRGTAVVALDEILARRAVTALARSGHELHGIVRSASELSSASHEAPAVVVVAAATTELAAAVAAARAELEHCLVVAIALDDRELGLRDALAADADAIVPEDELERSLGSAVSAVLAGHVVLPRTARQAARRPVLSTRERQIAGLVVLGLTNGEIAAKLHVAETTVKSHLTSIFRKLGVRSRNEAATRILDPHHGLGVGILSIAADPSLDVFDDAEPVT